MSLEEKHCIPCEGKIDPMSRDEEDQLLEKVDGWKIQRDGTHKIRKGFEFKDFKQAMRFVNEVAEIAEHEGHHPDIYIYYNKVELTLYTHAVGGLFSNDFVMAAKINAIPLVKTG
ncbi:4a-hydroxytetrahydrobiopterin dehydratase [Candidatus Bathyarchaeota archaeon]|nr:4a-hydroxytetrahydrobiopterin dehydratase [Candidatus Bathyarchaeota archaeon]